MCVHELAQRIFGHIRRHELLHPGDRVGVAVSGGADSVALLRLLLDLRKDLGVVLSVVHLNHKLRGADSDADAEFVANLARQHKLQLHSTTADVAQHASDSGISLETAAREVRYNYFRQLLTEVKRPELDKVVTGHILDDQAETVLMRVIRGTGTRGLRGIQPRLEIERENGTAEIVRPLLEVRRRELEAYLRDLGQAWREDATNLDPKFTRNRVRHLLLPLLEKEFNPLVTDRLGELAEIARAEEDYWDNEAAGWMETGIHWAAPERTQLVQLLPAGAQASSAAETEPEPEPTNAIVDLIWLLSEPPAVQRRIVKSVGDQAGIGLEFKHVEEILRFASDPAGGKELTLPQGWRVFAEEDHLEFIAPRPKPRMAADYEYQLDVPGEVSVPETQSVFQAVRLKEKESEDHNPEHVFDPERLGASLLVRNWRPGDRFWPAHTKEPKKIKDLLQARHLPALERKCWPVIVSGNEIVWVRGFPGRAHFRPAYGQANAGILIREVGQNPRGEAR